MLAKHSNTLALLDTTYKTRYDLALFFLCAMQLSEAMQGLHIDVKFTTTITFTNHQKLKLKLKIKKLSTIFYLLASKLQTSEFMMKKCGPCDIKSNHTRIRRLVHDWQKGRDSMV